MNNRRALVLGIGNTLLTDEGVGVHVVEYLRTHFPEQQTMSLIDGGTLSFSLAPLLEAHTQLIVVDAAVTGGDPGHVVCYEGDSMDRYLQGNRRSVHEVGLMDLLDIVRLSGYYPERRALVGIEPAVFDWGEQPSPSVLKSVPHAASLVVELVDKWLADDVE